MNFTQTPGGIWIPVSETPPDPRPEQGQLEISKGPFDDANSYSVNWVVRNSYGFGAPYEVPRPTRPKPSRRVIALQHSDPQRFAFEIGRWVRRCHRSFGGFGSVTVNPNCAGWRLQNTLRPNDEVLT